MTRLGRWYVSLALVWIAVNLAVSSSWAGPGPVASPTIPTWLEPRGLSVVDLVGQVPDAHLQGTILSYEDGVGIVVYESGLRLGSTVVVTATIYPRVSTASWRPDGASIWFGCLGQTPHFDHVGSVAPPSRLRVYASDGEEVTQQIGHMFLSNMDMAPPSTGSSAPYRYPQVHYGPGGDFPLPLGPEGLDIPANSGCQLVIFADYYPLTGVFTLTQEPAVQAAFLGSQSATFQSYIGVGYVGVFQGLMDQMRQNYPDRHGRVPLDIPADADSFLLKFPPMPGDAYTDSGPPYSNAARPTGGTYRLSDGGTTLSTNLVFSAVFPLDRAWQDADQAPGNQFLPVMADPTYLATPEYVLPAGVTYNDCFTQGNCSSAILQQIYDAEMTLEIIYLDVRHSGTQGQWVPLQMAGPRWPSQALDAPQAAGKAGDTVIQTSWVTTTTHTVFVPYVVRTTAEELPDCLCGWFDEWGRMLNFAPGP